jgi:hypothetical protein
VDKIRHDNQEIDVITDGYHRWHGAIPILSSRDIISNELMYLIGAELLNHIERLDISIILDPRA